MGERTRAIGYVRVSTEHQADGGVSLAAQRAKLEAYATAMDLDLVDIIEDPGVSAKTLDRPGLQRALGMFDAGQASALLVAKLDRLTRSVRDLDTLISRYFAARFSLLSVADSIDTRSAAGRLVLNVLASVSQWEREATAERTRDALAQLRADGVRLGGAALGWVHTGEADANGRRILARVQDEAATVDRILALRADGLSLREIAATLTDEGYRTKRGGSWAAETVRKVLARSRE
ncbi:recombinase family protein [Sorangium sp. So ce1097]|uniref:recombinase family protein n=1 Tax=Sorangium sp. So ce1097 TaxID=3133330 RepID=UPI003F61211B